MSQGDDYVSGTPSGLMQQLAQYNDIAGYSGQALQLLPQGQLGATSTINGFYQQYGHCYAQACTCYHTASPTAAVHHFTGAPKNEAKNTPCGRAMVTAKGKGFRLTGLEASTDIDDVTCVECLRALAGRSK